jgi:REP element-mobilizing transposase RayT
MARSLRIERANGVYHIINRGNYRHDLFINDGAHEAFERCLFEACEKCGWILEGHCVMTNHFHLVIRTPQGNLSYGMKWLQATFANRYHRFRKVHGKLFARQAALKAPVRQAHRRSLDSPAKRAAPSTRHALRQGRFKSLIVEEDGLSGCATALRAFESGACGDMHRG